MAGLLPLPSLAKPVAPVLILHRPTETVRAMPGMPQPSGLTLLGESVCPYCGVGCRLQMEGTPGQVLRVRAVRSAPANLGTPCAKGAQLGPTTDTHDRLKHPLLRLNRTDRLHEVGWDSAVAHVAERLRSIVRAHGPESVAFYGSGQLDS